jgi:hypothetical protein
MSYSPYSSYSHDTNYGNYDNGAYHLSDGAYHSTGYNHLGNDYGNNPPSPEPHRGYDKALVTRAAEFGLTPQELQEANEECIREQNEWLATTYGADRRDHEREETRGEQRVEVQSAREWEIERVEGMEQELEGYDEVHPGTPTHPTSFQPEQQVYEAPGMSDSPHDVATSPERDAFTNAGNTELDPEHTLSGYNDDGNAYTDTHTPFANHERDLHEVPGPHDDATSFGNGGLPNADTSILEPGDPSLDHKGPPVSEEGVMDCEGRLELQEEICTGEYIHSAHPPPPPASYPAPQPPPTSWHPRKSPNTSYQPRVNHPRPYPPHSRYQRGPTRAPRQHHEYRPPRIARTPRVRYRPPRRTVFDKYGERGPPPPPNLTNGDRVKPRSAPRHSLRLPKVSYETLHGPNETGQSHPKSPGSWRERPPHPHPPRHVSTRSDSPNWREAHPGRPISFKSPPSSPVDPNPTSESPPTDPQLIPALRTSPDLESLVKQTVLALRSIMVIAEKLVRRVNAERRIAHRTQGHFRVHEDVHGSVSRTQLPTFPSWRGPPVLGYSVGSDSIA